MNRLDPKLDLVFKLLLTRQPQLLHNMLEGILARPIESLTILDPDIPGEMVGDKEIILDIRAMLSDGVHVDVEMQIRATRALGPRLVFYAARDYADQLRRGDDYDRLAPTIVVVWLLEPMFPSIDRLHSIFELRERNTHELFSDQLAVHILQLSCLNGAAAPVPEMRYDVTVQRWARFLLADGGPELDLLAAQDPIMATAKQTLEELSQDPETRRRARERADAVKLYQMDLAAVRAEGRDEGEVRGQAKVLLKQLGLRFGPLPPQAEVRVRDASSEQLDRWTERVLTAETIDEVLAP